MRVKKIETYNFAGLGSVTLDDLHERHEVFVGGRNGVGKSQLLLAVALASRSDISAMELQKYIGSADNHAIISVVYQLGESESAQFVDVLRAFDGNAEFHGDELHSVVEISSIRYPEWKETDKFGNSTSGIMSDQLARRELPFADVTYLPADRSVERSPELALSLSSLSRERTRDVGQQTLSQEIADWTHTYQFDVFSSLAALHYAGLLTESESEEQSRFLADFHEISQAFERATGKRLHEPVLQKDGGIALEVEVPGAGRHRVNTLSAGELIALQILQFIKIHFERGSILLIDEPEQHLHPSLQVEIANAVRDEIGNGQLWMVTHSPNILSSIPGRDVLVLTRDDRSGSADAKFADTEEARLRMFDEIGVPPGLWVPGNFIAVVEGSTDEKYLRRLLPNQFSSAFFVVAGTGSSVASFADRMKENASLPFIAIRDRDRRRDDEVDEWNKDSSQFMWSGNAIESLFLNRDWILDTYRYQFPEEDLKVVERELAWVIQAQYADVKRLWLREEMLRCVPSNDNHRLPLRDFFENSAAKARERVDFLSEDNERKLGETFDELWNRDPLPLIDPKRALNQFVSRNGAVGSQDHLIQLMTRVLKEGHTTGPDDLASLSAKLGYLSLGQQRVEHQRG